MPGFIHELRVDDLLGAVIEQTQRCVLDLIGVAARGAATDMSQLARNHAARHFVGAGGAARMLFDGRPVSPVGAALAGGMTIDSMDAHDGHALAKGSCRLRCAACPARSHRP